MSERQDERVGIIGGSGLGDALLGGGVGVRLDMETPFGKPSGKLVLAEWEGVPVAFLARHGEGHAIPPGAVPYRANVWALKSVGCRWIMASGAVGSLREEIAPGDVVVCDQIIDKTTQRAGTFFDVAGAGAVHVEFAEPFCEDSRQILIEAGRALRHPGRVHEAGTYVCMEGPAFSTRAESLMHRQWGGDLIGMTAMPEAKLAREAEMSYTLVALATDYDCWRPREADAGKGELLREIIGNMRAASEHALELMKAAVPKLWARRGEVWAAHRSLELAIWTEKKRIPAADRERLALIWGRYV